MSLRGSTNLLSLDLQDTDVSDDGLQELKPLVNLRSLVLARTCVGDAGLEHLKSIPSLRSLNLSRLKITDRGMQSIRGLTQLTELTLRCPTVTDAGLECLTGLTGLRSLSLQDTQATDAALKHLKALTRLRRLNIRGTKASDAGLRHLAALVELKSLDIGNTRVSDAGLRHLYRLANLRCVNTYGSKVTEEALARMENVLPKLEATRVWDVTYEEFDHALLMRTPRCDVIVDGQAVPVGTKSREFVQLSGHERVALADPDDGQAPLDYALTRQNGVLLQCEVAGLKYSVNLETGQAAIGGTMIPLDGPSRTYLVDGHGRPNLADSSLFFDNHSELFLENPAKPPHPERQAKAVQGPAERKTDGRAAARRAAKLNFMASGAWNGKLVHGFFEREDLDKPVDPTDRSYPPFKFRSDVGLVFVFTRIPKSTGGLQEFLGPGDGEGEQRWKEEISTTSTTTPGTLVPKRGFSWTRRGRSTSRISGRRWRPLSVHSGINYSRRTLAARV